ncbi:lysine--tRNA ligase [Kiritimatiella glycovorans]|uniref:Lysine--tRNA ligase n=1 Tax=Kiritimatiella glycovorans TaxID=1307763 RepID=A0A0G3EFD9_9BACT|nr:lysine--tRNA ligase [Kiritimatiella glycovorans]AKJ65053.1 Lysine--tRNA ligase [Kiritimatiella glycovorans]
MTENDQAGNPDEYRAQREENMQRLKEAGYAPYGAGFERTDTLKGLAASFEEGRRVRAAGRLVTVRKMGKMAFAHLDDGSARLQLMVKRDGVGPDAFQAFKWLDLGDWIGVEGELCLTKTGEKTIRIDRWELLAKAFRTPPEKWHGLQDVETRYRRRYLDLMSNDDVRELFRKRTAMMDALRRMLRDRGYLEVETPMIQPLAGGAAARPFKTRYQALGADMYFRIAPELYLKRLIVGGLDRVFELNRNFRNEGLDRTHNPEFTALELYEAFGDRNTMQRLAQDLIAGVAEEIFGSLTTEWYGHEIDLTPPWREVTFESLLEEEIGGKALERPAEELRAEAEKRGIEVEPDWSVCKIAQEIYEHEIEPHLTAPTFVTRLPAELVPLAKPCDDDPRFVDVFELVIGGREIAPAYSELNDPAEQRRRFEAQAGGDPSKIDVDFLESLEYGMPPTGGMGIGIDRLFMLLTGSEAIRDVILFPQMRAK